MNILIIGCGRVGSELASQLDIRGHDVSVIDKTSECFERLPASFGGFTTAGVPIDKDVLKSAGIETCDALCAVTDDDNMNIMAAQLASEVFKVPKVFARIVDKDKDEVFEEFGICTVCPTSLTVNAACAALEEDTRDVREVNFEMGTVQFTTMAMPDEFVGRLPEDIELEEDEILFGIIRSNGLFLLYKDQSITLGKDDKLIFAKKE